MIELYSITHKKIKNLPHGRKPLLVGASNNEENFGYDFDSNFIDNISMRNQFFCEMTGIYYLWKSKKCDYIGIEHYRRYFYNDKFFFYHRILSKEKIEIELKKYDIIVPKKHYWPTYINQYEQYKNEHLIKDLDILQNVIFEEYPDYIDSWNKVIHQNRWFYNYNMFISSKKIFDEYCSFVFPILFEIENRINVNDGRNDYQKRVFGFLDERLFNVWLEKNKQYKLKEFSVINIEESYFRIIIRKIYRLFKWRKVKKYNCK